MASNLDIPDFRKAFRNGARIRDSELGEFRMKRCEIGRLVVTTGRIVACDPICYPNMAPFRRRVPLGRHPVFLSLAQQGRSSDIAAAMLRLTQRPPLRWQMATRGSERLKKLRAGRGYCYPVDSATGCFMDALAAEILRQRMERDEDCRQRLINAKSAEFKLDAETGLNLVMFMSGDGEYPSYWGFDCDGNIACLVTDFFVLPCQGTA